MHCRQPHFGPHSNAPIYYYKRTSHAAEAQRMAQASGRLHFFNKNLFTSSPLKTLYRIFSLIYYASDFQKVFSASQIYQNVFVKKSQNSLTLWESCGVQTSPFIFTCIDTLRS